MKKKKWKRKGEKPTSFLLFYHLSNFNRHLFYCYYWLSNNQDTSIATDGIPSSGMTIPPQRRMELLGLQPTGGDSEDEMSESISELPSFGGQKAPRKRLLQKPEVFQLFFFIRFFAISHFITFAQLFLFSNLFAFFFFLFFFLLLQNPLFLRFTFCNIRYR